VNASDPHRSAREELREQLLQAARRDDVRQAARKPARRRRSRRGLAIVIALGFGAAAAAGAADLISTGDPLPDSNYSGTPYGPSKAGAPPLDAKAPDPAGGHGWGVGTYTAGNGDSCAIAGQVRGVTLGEVGKDGQFHPFERGSTGSCGSFKRLNLFYDVKHYDGVTIVFGRTSERNRYVTARNEGKTIPATPGRNGAFLWVFKGNLLPIDVPVALGGPIKP
jgi:hypothetical protein